MLASLVFFAASSLASPQIIDLRVGFFEGVATTSCTGQARVLGRTFPLVFSAPEVPAGEAPSASGVLEARLELDRPARYAWLRIACDGAGPASAGVVFFHDVRHDTLEYLVAPGDDDTLAITHVVPGFDAGRLPGRETLWKLLAGAWGVALVLAATRLKSRRPPP
jgi:hypothetical protein